MNKKHSSPAQKKISQQVAFQRRVNASKNIEQASNVCFSVLAKSMRKDSFTEFLYMFRNFLELPAAKNIMNYRYKGDSIDIFKIKTMPFEMLEIKDVVKWLTEIFVTLERI
jgi:enolase